MPDGRDPIVHGVPEAYEQGIREMGMRGPQVGGLDWLNAIAHVLTQAAIGRGGVEFPTRDPLMEKVLQWAGKWGSREGGFRPSAGQVGPPMKLLPTGPKDVDTGYSVAQRARSVPEAEGMALSQIGREAMLPQASGEVLERALEMPSSPSPNEIEHLARMLAFFRFPPRR